MDGLVALVRGGRAPHAGGDPALASRRLPLAVEAASQGIGVALGWTWIIRQQMDEGLLVPAHPYRLRTSGGFYVIRSAHRHTRRIVREMEDWLISTNPGG